MAERKPPLILLGSGARAGAGRGSEFSAASLDWREPAWLGNGALYEGVRTRRAVAYFLDALLSFLICAVLGFVSCTLTVGTLGLIGIPAFVFATPFVHFVLASATIGGRRGATPGMRAMGLRAVAWTGENPGPLRGIILTALFYATVPTTGFLILVFSLFDPRGRCLHDHLAGLVFVRDEALPRL
ncbi:MAG TPA: RDD family protein [Candidatus Binatia bacterium]|nr:RDD family protein [Candidatus Binatia bacterium]